MSETIPEVKSRSIVLEERDNGPHTGSPFDAGKEAIGMADEYLGRDQKTAEPSLETKKETRGGRSDEGTQYENKVKVIRDGKVVKIPMDQLRKGEFIEGELKGANVETNTHGNTENKERKENTLSRDEFVEAVRLMMYSNKENEDIPSDRESAKKEKKRRREGKPEAISLLRNNGVDVDYLMGSTEISGDDKKERSANGTERRRIVKMVNAGIARKELIYTEEVDDILVRMNVDDKKMNEWGIVAMIKDERLHEAVRSDDGESGGDDGRDGERQGRSTKAAINSKEDAIKYIDGAKAAGPRSLEAAVRYLRKRANALAEVGGDEDFLLSEQILEEVDRVLGKEERVDIPRDNENNYRLFMRSRIRETIEKQSNSDRLSFDNIERELRTLLNQEIGNNGLPGKNIEIYPSSFGDELDRIKQEIREEIEARCNLKTLELQELRYKGIADKNTALSVFVKEMTGKDQSEANPSVISNETYRWLQSVDELGDENLTREGVDKSLAVLLSLGEKNPDFTGFPELMSYAAYRAPGLPNYYESKYNPDMKSAVDQKLVDDFGVDSVRIARQILAAYKEEANYNKEHYLSGIYQFAESRAGLAKDKTYVGSMRVYEHPEPPHHTSYKDEIRVLGISPLNVPAVFRKDPDPTPDDPNKTKDIKEKGLYKDRALDGRFLRDNPELGNTSWSKSPELVAFGSVKKGVEARDRIVEIGKLGDEKDKVGAISKAVDSLTNLRISLQELVTQEVVTQAEADRQMFFEARNSIYELSIEKSSNLVELNRQQPNKPNFLLPTNLSVLFEKLGLVAKDSGHRIIDQADLYANLAAVTNYLRSQTFEIIQNEDMADIDGDVDGDKKRELIEDQERDVYYIDLSTAPGERNTKRENKFFKKVVKVIDAPQNLVRKVFYAVLSWVPFFGKTISKPFKGDL